MNNPLLLTIITIIAWGFGASIIKFISFKSQFILPAISYLVTFIIFIIYTYFLNKKTFLQKLKNVQGKFLFVGLFGYFIYLFAFIQSFRSFNNASEPTVLNYTWPIFTVLFTELFFRKQKEKDKRVYVIEGIAISIGFLSLILLATQGNMLAFQIANIPGIAWGLLAGSSYGFFSAYSSTVSRDKQDIFLLSAVFSSLMLISICSISEIQLLSTFSIQDYIFAGIAGSLTGALGYITWTRANMIAKERKISISSIASLIYFLPVLSLIIVTIIFRETTLFQPYFLVVLFLLLSSSILSQKAEQITKYFK